MYTQEIPGVSVFTPVTQLRVNQSPRLGGLGSLPAQETNPLNSALETAKQIVRDNPVPVLIAIGYLLFRK